MEPPPLNIIGQLINELSEQEDLDIWGQPGLKLPKEAHVLEANVEIPDFGELVKVEQVGDFVYWGFEIPEHISATTSLVSSEVQTPTLLKYKIRHDFVSEAITTEGTDRKLGEEIEKLNNDDDNLTPDVFIRDDKGNIFIIEIGTSKSPTELGLIRTYREKLFKYEIPISDRRLNHSLIYCVIIVGINKVISNYVLPQVLINELLIRMKIGIALEDVAIGKGIKLTSDSGDTAQTRLAADILFELDKVKAKDPAPSNKITIDLEFIADVRREVDTEAVWNAFETSLMNVKETILEDRKITHNSRIKSYKDSLPNVTKCRMDSKAVVQLPLVLTHGCKPSIDIENITLAPGMINQHLQNIWSHVFMFSKRSENFFPEDINSLLEEALQTDYNEIKDHEKKRKLHRNKWHRVDMKPVLTKEVLSYLRKDGVFTKSVKEQDYIKSRKKEQKKPFWYHTNTQDIEDFIRDPYFLECDDGGLQDHMENVIDLVQKAEQLSENPDIGTKFLNNWAHTRLFKMLDLISDIAHELAISIKQNTNSNEMLLKKLRNHPVYLLIKTTNSNSHLFYSIYVPKESIKDVNRTTVFRSMIALTRGYATDFVSVRVSKIQNLANASSTLLTMVSFWSDFYGLSDATPSCFRNNIEARKMLMLSMLTSLEDKAQTEEVMTMSRYMYMEIFKGTINVKPPNPFKMMEKFPTCIRSRLCLWIIKQLISSFSSMTTIPPYRLDPEEQTQLVDDEDALPGDEWRNLLNCYTGAPLLTATSAVNLMYLGYLKNKNETAEGNVEWKMLEKILEEEFECKEEERERYNGKIPKDQLPGKKQFSKESIKHGSSILEARLKKQLGDDWRIVLENEIADSLSRHLTHEIATLKASSICDHNKIDEPAVKNNIKKIWRIKVVEAIASKLGLTGLNPMLHIDKLIKFVEDSSAGVICDLFKKNQHGGLREIYVLTIESRLIQLFVETISRTICLHFEEETLTHPQNKLKLLDDHKARMAKLSRKNNSTYADFCSSSDKTRWNQNLVMTALIIPLVRITTPKFHNAIYRSLNLWANKFIKIPTVVLNLLINKIPLSSETYTELLGKFWDHEMMNKNTLGMKKPKTTFVNLTTGMMQGILHYTSSLLHLTFLASQKEMTLNYLRKLHPKHTFCMVQVCSSDDSATILTVQTESDKSNINLEDIRAFYDAELMLECATLLCRFYCMRESGKSTIAASDYVEFNSEFIFKNTIAMPTIKFVAASLNLSESESFIKRFYNMYNLISDLLSSGFPSLNTYYCQISQAYQHYKTLGASSHPLFYQLYHRLMNFPEATHGFFLLDTHRCCGLLGYSFSRWMANSNDANLANSMKFLQIGEIETLPDGGVTTSLVIKHGDLRRWNTLMDRVESGSINPSERTQYKDKLSGEYKMDNIKVSERKDRINSNHELFFRHPENLEELRDKLLIKASMPGVATALGKGDPFIQSLSLSVYAINTHSFTRTKTIKKMEGVSGVPKLVKETTKHSLLSAIDEITKLDFEEISAEEIDQIQENMFPLRSRYEEALSIIRSFESADEILIHRFRHMKTLLYVQPRVDALPISLLKVCAKWWFGHTARMSNRVYSRCRDEYCLAYPWLRDSFSATLEQSPFQNALELYNFISTQATRSRKFMFYGPAIRSNRFSGQVGQIIRRFYKRGVILSQKEGMKSKAELIDKEVSCFSLALLIPVNRKRRQIAAEVLSHVSNQYDSTEDLLGLSKKQAIVGLLSMVQEQKISDLEALTYIRNIKHGSIITFTKSQYKVNRGGNIIWAGEGECIANCDGINLRVRMRDEEITHIYVKDFRPLRKNPGALVNLYEQLSSRPSFNYFYQPKCAARFNGSSFVSPEGQGTPIIIDETIEDIFTDPPRMSINYKYSSCSLQYNRDGRVFNLLEFKTSYKDVSSYTEEVALDDVWGAWIHQRPLSHNEALRFLINADKILKDPSRDKEEIERISIWITSTLTNRLKYRRIGYAEEAFVYSLAGESATADEDTDDDFVAFMTDAISRSHGFFDNPLLKQFDDDIVKAAQEMTLHETDADEKAMEEAENINISHVLQYEYKFSPIRPLLSNYSEEVLSLSQSVMRRDMMNFLYLHPFWDNFINTMVENEFDFFMNLLQGIVSYKNSDQSKLLMRILKITEREEELNITQRHKKYMELRRGSDDVW
uniref:Putative replicase n=1 Tax=Ogsystermes virus TaxID=2796623 RepID=A0A894KFF4_9VIRU|nr:putative replicase [Ogsystermes virus]